MGAKVLKMEWSPLAVRLDIHGALFHIRPPGLVEMHSVLSTDPRYVVVPRRSHNFPHH